MKAVANRPIHLERRSFERAAGRSSSSLFDGHRAFDDSGDENDDVMRRMIGDRGSLAEDMDLNDGNSAYSDHPSNGPPPKDWPSDA